VIVGPVSEIHLDAECHLEMDRSGIEWSWKNALSCDKSRALV